MSRNTDKQSVRQQAFAELDKMAGKVSRKDAANALMEKFDIGSAYAMTIYQQHRNAMKESGDLVTVYSVKETKDNELSVVTSHVLKPGPNDATDPAVAVKNYVDGLNGKIKAASSIDTKAIVAAEKAAVEAKVKAETEKAEALAAKEAEKAAKAAEKEAKAKERAEAKAAKEAEKAAKAEQTESTEAKA